MALDVAKLAETLGLSDDEKQRIENVAARQGTFKDMLQSVLSVKDSIDEQKRTVLEYLRAAEHFLEEAAAFAGQNGVDSKDISLLLSASSAERSDTAGAVFTHTREFRRLGTAVALEAVDHSKRGGRTALEAQMEEDAMRTNMNTNYQAGILSRVQAAAERLLAAPLDATNVVKEIGTHKDAIFTAMLSRNAATIQSAIRAAKDAVVKKILTENASLKPKQKAKLPFDVDQLVSVFCMAAFHVSTPSIDSDLPMHEAILAAIMKKAPDESKVAEMMTDYKKVAEVGNAASVKVKLSNGVESVFYMEKPEVALLPVELKAYCEASNGKPSAHVIDVDYLTDISMLQAIAQMGPGEKMKMKLIADLGVGKEKQEIIIGGMPGTSIEFRILKVNDKAISVDEEKKIRAALEKTPMKYLDRDFKLVP